MIMVSGDNISYYVKISVLIYLYLLIMLLAKEAIRTANEIELSRSSDNRLIYELHLSGATFLSGRMIRNEYLSFALLILVVIDSLFV